MLFFADSAERAVVQATMMGGVAIVITSTLLVLWFLDHPYHSGPGGLQPVAMERTIRILDQEATAIDQHSRSPATSVDRGATDETAVASRRRDTCPGLRGRSARPRRTPLADVAVA